MLPHTSISMAKPWLIIRKAIHTFLCQFHHLTAVAALLAAPSSFVLLLSQSLIPSSPASSALRSRALSLLTLLGLPTSSELFNLLAHKFSRTILTAIAALPFTLTSLACAKAVVIRTVCHRTLPSTKIHGAVFRVQLWNCFAMLATDAFLFMLLFAAFRLVMALGFESEGYAVLGVSAATVIVCSVVLAHVAVVCNLAVVMAAMENNGGYKALLKAVLLMRGREATAVSVSLPTNLSMVAVEALFKYRVAGPYPSSSGWWTLITSEAPVIVSMHAVLVVLDVVASCVFFESCVRGGLPRSEGRRRAPEVADGQDDGGSIVCTCKCEG